MAATRVRVSVRASRNGIVGRYRGGWKLRVAAPFVSGRTSRDKIVEPTGIDAAESQRRLAAGEAR